MTTYYKVLDSNRRSPVAAYRWPAPGRWTPLITRRLQQCAVGYHVTRRDSLWRWLPRTAMLTKRVAGQRVLRRPFCVWLVETRGRGVPWGSKIGFRQARLKYLVAFCQTPDQRTAFLRRLRRAQAEGKELTPCK